MLKTLSTELVEPRKGGVGVGSDNKAKCSGNKINRNGINDIEVDGSEVKFDEVGKNV